MVNHYGWIPSFGGPIKESRWKLLQSENSLVELKFQSCPRSTVLGNVIRTKEEWAFDILTIYHNFQGSALAAQWQWLPFPWDQSWHSWPLSSRGWGDGRQAWTNPGGQRFPWKQRQGSPYPSWKIQSRGSKRQWWSSPKNPDQVLQMGIELSSSMVWLLKLYETNSSISGLGKY